MKNKPTVSVVVATYNGEKYIREQLDSIISQTYPLLEIIVQDDHSTDSTIDILKEYAKKDERVKVFLNEAERGINGNFFSAIKRAQGSYIAISDQDDIWLPDKIEKQVRAIDGKALCGGRDITFSSDGVFTRNDSRMPNYGLLRIIYITEIAGHTMLFSRQWLESLPVGTQAFKAISTNRYYDYVLALSAAATNDIVWVNDALVKFRRHNSASTYTSTKDSSSSLKNGLNMLAWCLRHYRRVKNVSRYRFHMTEMWLREIDSTESIYSDALNMLRLQQSSRLIDLLRLQCFCLKHHSEILHTKGKGAKSLLQAWLYPFLSCWYSRFLPGV